MKGLRPGLLSVRAVNQYRRRDVLCYLALRYYLYNSAARQDQWARQIATDLAATRSSSPYFRANHFKEIKADGTIEHRAIFLPGANEALAETALLDECSRHPQVFDNPSCVYSYRLSKGGDRSGAFQYYIGGLRDRHQAIAEACDAFPNGVVRYTDIKRFYPSIETGLALGAWQKQCDLARLPDFYRSFGEKLLGEHDKTGAAEDGGILTGPMFSHLIGNLVLRGLDEDLSTSLSVRYFRYVDDIVLVGETDDVVRTLTKIRDRIGDLGLRLHDDVSPKSMEVSTGEWLEGRDDFRDSRRTISWMTLVSDLKQFLILKAEERERIHDAFRDEGFRLPIRDYTSAVYDVGYLQKMRQWASKDWFRRRTRKISIKSLIDQARQLRETYETEYRGLLSETAALEGFNRKRRIPKLRYRGSRLIYLATDDALARLGPSTEELPELYFHARVMEAVASGNIDQVLTLGTNAAQAAAQPLRAAGKRATSSHLELQGPEEQALAVFLLNGVQVEGLPQAPAEATELLSFAINGADRNLMKSADPFIQEIACLHGITDRPRHPELLEAAYDEDEDLALDAISQLQQSFSV